MLTLPRWAEVKCWTIYLDSWPDIKWNPFSSILHGQSSPIVSQVLRAGVGHRNNSAHCLLSRGWVLEAQRDIGIDPHTLSSALQGNQNKAAWVGVEIGSIAIIYFNGPLYFITKEWMYLLLSIVGPMLWKLRSTKQNPFVKCIYFPIKKA